MTEQTNLHSSQNHAHTLVQLERVTRSYAEAGQHHIVLDELDATFAQGEIVVIMGKSGSGKSTLLNLVSGIDIPLNGNIWVQQHHITCLSEHERTRFRRQTIGFIFQFFNLIHTLTVIENVLLPLELNNISGTHAKRLAHDMLAHVGLQNRCTSYPDRLSGGEQQRVAIARALVHNPPLILADEPTGNLDSDTSEHILALLESLTRQTHKTMIIVTHSTEVARRADRVFHLREGKLVETQL